MSRPAYIDYGSTPPVPTLRKTAPHLSNYRRVYRASERAAQPAEAAKPETLEDYLAGYERNNARHVVIKARDLESTFDFKVRNEDVAQFCKDPKNLARLDRITEAGEFFKVLEQADV